MDEIGEGYFPAETYDDPKKMYHPIPPKLIHILIKQGWITFPVPPEQEWGLRLLQRVWADRHKTFLRFMLSEMEPAERALLAEFPRYTKVDRYVLKLLLGVDELAAMAAEGETAPQNKPRKKYSSTALKEMVWAYFGQTISDEELERLRQVARNYRRGTVSKKSKANLLRALAETV